MRAFRLGPRSFRTQITLATVLLVGVSMVLLTVVVQLLLLGIAQRDADQVLDDRAESVVTATRADSTTTIVVPDAVLDEGVVVFDGSGRVIAGAVPGKYAHPVDDLSHATARTRDSIGDDQRLLAVPFTAAGQPVVVVVIEQLAPYETAGNYALVASIGLGLLVTAAAAFVALWVTKRALAPVAQMASTAAEWSEHDLGQRFALGAADNEITKLGATLDRLLDRVALTIRGEQRLTSELAHELRTPLASVLGAAELALMRGGLTEDARVDVEQIVESGRLMSQTITTLLDLARNTGRSLGFETCTVGDLAATLEATWAEHPVSVRTQEADLPVVVAAPPLLAARAVTPVVDNAVRHAHSQVRVEIVVRASEVDVVVTDDGPGVSAELAGRIFEPGASGSAGGTGLGLGIARRVSRSLGGDVDLGDQPRSGARFVVRLPRP